MEPIYTPPPVTGYRKLTQREVDLMNEIKALGDNLRPMIERLRSMQGMTRAVDPERPEMGNCPMVDGRWVSIGATDIQTGIMALVRAVAQPTNF